VHGDEVARPDEDFGADPGLAQHPAHAVGDAGERVDGAGVGRDEDPGALVLLGVQDREDQVLQFGLEGLHAQAFGEGDQNVPGDLGDPGLFLGPHDAEGAHVVQPVGQFDRHHAYVVAGGDQHLAEGLRFGGGSVVDLLQFGDAVHQIGDFLAEFGPHLIERHFGVLDGVVEEGSGQGGGFGAQFGEDQRHGERMRDVGLAALAELAAVGRFGEDVRPVQHGQIGVGVVGPVRVGHMADGVGQPVPGDRAEQCRAAEPTKVDPGTASSAALSTRICGLCTHGAPPAASTGGGGTGVPLRTGA
jgi:hypothetical protein